MTEHDWRYVAEDEDRNREHSTEYLDPDRKEQDEAETPLDELFK